MSGKCPHCKEEIESLNAYSEIVQTYLIDEKGEGYAIGEDYCEGYTEFNCPECHDKICESEEVAIKFLKGENYA